MRIREARPADLETVVALLREDVIREVDESEVPVSAYVDAFTEIMGDAHQQLLVGELADEVVATAQVTWVRNLTYVGGLMCSLESVRVRSDRRGKGLGGEPGPRVLRGARVRPVPHRHEALSRRVIVRLHHVQVSCPVGGEDAARRFYRDVLGLPEVEKPPVLAARGGCWFREGSVEVHVGVEEDFVPARKAHPAFLVHDLDVLAARAAEAGFSVTWNRDLPGYRRFHTADGNGNRVELLATS